MTVQALDHATGYFKAASVLKALKRQADTGGTYRAKLSLAATAHLLTKAAQRSGQTGFGSGFEHVSEADLAPEIEETSRGPGR